METPTLRTPALKIALLGAESTGKTQLAGEMAAHWTERGHKVAIVTEVLREWCAREGRTPRPEEQMPIAQEQQRRVDEAAASHQIVIADTTSLMVAIYSAMLFKDGTLYNFALERQRTYDATLVTGLDIPWVADGLQRDGPHVREPVDALVRDALRQAGVTYRVVYGSGPQRLENALTAVASFVPELATVLASERIAESERTAWVWQCDKCSDPDCEHRLFTGLRNKTQPD